MGWELAGRRLGVVGYGAVGREVAGLAAGLGMEVVAHDPHLSEAPVPLLPLDDLLSTSDAVSLHVPLNEETAAMIGLRELRLMRRGAVLVNTSRGGVVDEAALAEALRDGRLAGAAFDCFDREPPVNSPLLEVDTFLASPHAGAATEEAARRAGIAAVRALLAAHEELVGER